MRSPPLRCVLFAAAACLPGPATTVGAFELIGVKWTAGSVNFRINPNFPGALAGTADNQLEIIQCASEAWVDQSRARFRFNYAGTTTKNTYNENDGVNIVAYSTADGGDALAATLINGQGNVASSFDILFFDKSGGTTNHWSGTGEPQSGEFDIGGVATHELGHALGLDHSKIPQATMFASASGRAIGMRTLHQDDRDGVESIYGTRTTDSPAVTITSVTPAEGPTSGGNEVVIEGANFTYKADSLVLLGGTPLGGASFSVESCSRIRIPSMPAHGAGPVSLEVSNTVGSVTLPDAYHYGGPAPKLISVSPVEGPLAGSISIEISGENITPDAIVTIGGMPLLDQEVVNGTTIRGRVPPGSANGAVDVKLEQGLDSSVLSDGFTYNAFSLRIAHVQAAPGQTDVPVTATVTSPDDLSSVSFGVVYDGSKLSVESASTAGTPAQPADFVAANIQNNSGVTTVGIILDIDGSAVTFPAGTDVPLVNLFVKVDPSASVGSNIDLRVENEVGIPPIQLIFTRAGSAENIRPLTVDGGVDVVEGVTFLRGDVNGDEKLDISDPVFLLEFLFKGGTRGTCDDAADSNDDGKLDISDTINLLGFLFQGGESLPAPFPGPGVDPTPDALGCGS